MNVFFPALLAASLSMSAVIVLLLLLNKLSENKIPATLRYYVWLIVLVGLLIPFRPNIPMPFAPLQIATTFEAADTFGVTDEHTHSVKTNTNTDLPPAASIVEKSSVPYTFIMFGAWIIGALAFLAFHLWSYGRFVSAIHRWGVEIGDTRILSVMRSVQNDMGLQGKKIVVKACTFISAPILIGFLKPTIILPEKEIHSDELDYIFRHELTHYKRKDLWVNILVLLVSAMHWFNPFVYLMAKVIRVDCEAACDEAVVYGNSIEWRKNYGETIISFIGCDNTKTPALSVLSTYFYRGSKSMEKRLLEIMNTKQKSKMLASGFAAIVIMTILMFGNVISVSASTVKGLPQSPQQQVQLTHPTQSPQQAVTANALQHIDEAKAQSIALSFAGFTESEVSQINVRLKKQNKPSAYYEVKFNNNLIKYEVDVRPTDGAILELEVDYTSAVGRSSGSGNFIGEANAKSIVLSLVGVSEADISKMKVKLHNKNTKPPYYEIEFYHGQIEYEYKLDAFTGTVLKVEIDYKKALTR